MPECTYVHYPGGGRSRKCTREAAEGSAHCEAHRAKQKRKNTRRRARHWVRFRDRLRFYGVPPDDAERLAHEWADPKQRCSICGISQARIYRWAARGFWPMGTGTPRHWRRLNIDHIDPYGDRPDPENMRLLCHQCNWIRRRGIKSDDEVWRKSFKRWTEWMAERQMRRWLHCEPPSTRGSST